MRIKSLSNVLYTRRLIKIISLVLVLSTIAFVIKSVVLKNPKESVAEYSAVANLPVAVAGSAVVYEDNPTLGAKNIYILGGFKSKTGDTTFTYSNALNKFNVITNELTPVCTHAAFARQGSPAIFVPNDNPLLLGKIYFFAGGTGNMPNSLSRSIYEVDLNNITNNNCASAVTSLADEFGQDLGFMSATYDPVSKKAYIVGAMAEDYDRINKIWEFDVATKQVTEKFSSDLTGVKMWNNGLSHTSAVFLNGKVYFSGGFYYKDENPNPGTRASDKIFVYDPNDTTGSPLSIFPHDGSIFTTRATVYSSANSGVAFLVGGRSYGVEENSPFTDIIRFDPTDSAVPLYLSEEITPDVALSPAVALRGDDGKDYIYMFGGVTFASYHNNSKVLSQAVYKIDVTSRPLSPATGTPAIKKTLEPVERPSLPAGSKADFNPYGAIEGDTIKVNINIITTVAGFTTTVEDDVLKNTNPSSPLICIPKNNEIFPSGKGIYDSINRKVYWSSYTFPTVPVNDYDENFYYNCVMTRQN